MGRGGRREVASPFLPKDLRDCLDRMRTFWDEYAPVRDTWRRRNKGYYKLIDSEYQYLIPPGSRVLEIGCGTGDLLASLKPSYGLGIDLSGEMIERCRQKYPQENLRFETLAVEELDLEGETFDYIVMSELLPFVYDILTIFHRLKPLCHERTRLVMNFYSRLYQPLYGLLERVGLKAPQPILNWVTEEDVTGLLQLSGFETVLAYPRILSPKGIWPIQGFLNRFAAPFWPFRWMCLTHFMVARLPKELFEKPPVVSVICPCRNEAGNIESIVQRLPEMGAGTELIFVEGHSADATYDKCLEVQQAHPDRPIQVYQQEGKGKADAVWLGFSKASGDVVMILDADMTVPPEDLPAFYNTLRSGQVEFVNGSRLVYTMEKRAMRLLNLVANKLFGMTFSFLISQPVKDTLCGTKAMLRSDYEKIARERTRFGHDPFGDFHLLFGAAKLGLRIHDLPVRYRDRTYGTTQISRFRHGLMLFRMCWIAFKRLKCH